MNNVFIEEKYILEYIKSIIIECRKDFIKVENTRYHHNSAYKDAPLIIQYGILSLLELNKRKIKDYSKETLKVMSDVESHINGNNGISLSVVGLTDLYRDEIEYDPFNANLVDFVISSDIKASRMTTHYGNEFVTNDSITKDKIKSIDVRLLKYMENVKNLNDLQKLIENYNYLICMANSVLQYETNNIIREMSFDDKMSLDVNKLSKMPVLNLKK